MVTVPPSDSGADPADPLATLIRRAGRRDSVPSKARERVRAAVHQEWKRSLRTRFWRRSAIWSAAAAAVLVGSIATYGWLSPTANPVIGTVTFVRGSGVTLHEPRTAAQKTAAATATVVANSTVETDADSRIGLQLTDGRQIRLDHGTRITIASNASVTLDYGSVFIDSGPATGPFALSTRSGIVTDIGTQFEVASAAASLRVRVRTGRISVEHQGTTSHADAGVELSVAADGDVQRRTVNRDDPAWNWALSSSTPYVLTGMTLSAFLDRVCAEGGYELHLAADLSRSAATVRLNGSLPEATPTQALETVLPTCGLGYTITEKVLNIERLPATDAP